MIELMLLICIFVALLGLPLMLWFGYTLGTKHGKAEATKDYESIILALTDGKGLPERIVEKVVEVPVEKIVVRTAARVDCKVEGCGGQRKVLCSSGSCPKHCHEYCGFMSPHH